MLRKIALGTLALFAGSLAVSAAPKDDVAAAAAKLADTSYTWKTTSESPGAAAAGQGGQGRRGGGFGGGGNMNGKVEKGGFAHLSRTTTVQGEERTTEAYMKDGKGAYKGQEGWMGFADQQPAGDAAAGGRGRGGFGAAGFRTAVLPAAQAADLATKTKELKTEGDAISGELTEEGAKSLLAFGGGGGRRGGQGGNAPTPPDIKNPKGTVKYWIKDGAIAKYQYNVQGSMSFNDNEININRTTTVEISNVGSTKVTVPDEAKSKVS